MKKIVVILICLLFVVGCEESITFKTITSEKAHEIMMSESDYYILDVRTSNEYESSHIKDSINVPLNDIEDKISSVISDKDALILVYCASGNRSRQASSLLASMGYTNVKNFGGLNNWKYELVSENGNSSDYKR